MSTKTVRMTFVLVLSVIAGVVFLIGLLQCVVLCVFMFEFCVVNCPVVPLKKNTGRKALRASSSSEKCL